MDTSYTVRAWVRACSGAGSDPNTFYAAHFPLKVCHTGLFFLQPPINRRLRPPPPHFPPPVGAELQPATSGKESYIYWRKFQSEMTFYVNC